MREQERRQTKGEGSAPLRVHGGVLVPALGEFREIPDSRAGFANHPAWAYAVSPTSESIFEDLRDLLGFKAVCRLSSSSGTEVDFSRHLPTRSQLLLFLDSNGKASRRADQFRNDVTTQEEDLRACGFRRADSEVALVYSARLEHKARCLGLDLEKGPEFWLRRQWDRFYQLSEGEQVALVRLGEGAIATNSGVLAIARGHLCFALETKPIKSPRLWVFGSPAV